MSQPDSQRPTNASDRTTDKRCKRCFLGRVGVCNLRAEAVYNGALCVFTVRQGSQRIFIFGNENLSLQAYQDCRYVAGSCLDHIS